MQVDSEPHRPPARIPDVDLDEDDYGSEIELDAELEGILAKAEAKVPARAELADIEDIILPERLSPFQQFRRKGWLSVSDLVGTIWCEVQYDYRLRTMPYLPVDQRPQVITSRSGTEIPVDKVKLDGKERILKRGEKIHKRLEREIHPDEIVIHAETREDVWGLRFLNMFSALEALLTLGKCRELPVVGFVGGVLIMGVIDEISREPIDSESQKHNTRSKMKEDKSQTSLTSFFSPTKPRPVNETKPAARTHRLFISDSKTRAAGTLPKDSDTTAGKYQVMLYKEILDAMLLAAVTPASTSESSLEQDPYKVLPTERSFSWAALFAEHLDLNTEGHFSEGFLAQSRPVILGNGLRYGVDGARCLRDMLHCWNMYVAALGLGQPRPQALRKVDSASAEDNNLGRTEPKLELVYRRAAASKRSGSKKKGADRSERRKGRSKGKGKRRRDTVEGVSQPYVSEISAEERMVQIAIQNSLKDMPSATDDIPQSASTTLSGPPISNPATVDQAALSSIEIAQSTADVPDAAVSSDDEELAWAVEMSLGADANTITLEDRGEVILRGSQGTALTNQSSPPPRTPSPPSSDTDTASKSPPGGTAKPSSLAPETSTGTASGSIIGRSVFTHAPRNLTLHLLSVLEWWMGYREAVGVGIEETRRCEWCEFEEGCEWRAKKAEEARVRTRGSTSA